MNELICVNPKNYKLTLDKKYTVIIDEGETVMIVNDNNKTVRYYKDLFQEVEEEVIPEPEPVIVRTEQDLIDSIATDNLNTTYIDFNNQIRIVHNKLSILNNPNEFSCGIKNVVNIKSQGIEICRNVEVDANNMEEDLPLLTKALFNHHIKSFIRSKLNSYDAGLYLLSCNVTGDNCLSEETVDVLNEISDFNTQPELNPNSGNQIKLWGIVKSNLDN